MAAADATSPTGRIAVVGAGLVGRAWAIVFARAGRDVSLYDRDADALGRAHALIEQAAGDLAEAGLVDESPATIAARVTASHSLEAALDGACYVQENTPEIIELKQQVFTALDAAAPPEAVLASSTSGIRASVFSEHVQGRHRCLVAHPVNPPSVVPVVELSGAPWTDPSCVDTARALMLEVGQVPVTVLKEIDGFILNRLQGALLNEAMRLVADGYVSAADLDKTVSEGLGLRWSFMGPMETIDLNAPGGIEDYCGRYGPMYHAMGEAAEARPYDAALTGAAVAERRAALDMDAHGERQAWRDKRLMALAAHKRAAAKETGE